SVYLASQRAVADSGSSLIQEHVNSVLAQARLAGALARISPYTSMVSLAREVSGTGIAEFVERSRQATMYRSLWAGAWEAAFQTDAIRKRDLSLELPRFSYQWRTLGERFHGAAKEAVFLVFWAVLFYLATYSVWVRSDEALRSATRA
ncbi:MAG: DUF3526 domain-containing protein, partial [Chitinivibrionales bacterium]|nr:DUF3526 domain-containing protein [Chitinivibrionales bacterium]